MGFFSKCHVGKKSHVDMRRELSSTHTYSHIYLYTYKFPCISLNPCELCKFFGRVLLVAPGGWVNRQRSAAPIPWPGTGAQPRALPSSCLSTNLRGELPPLLFIERRRELSKQLPTLVEKTQIFYLVKEFALLPLPRAGPAGVWVQQAFELITAAGRL